MGGGVVGFGVARPGVDPRWGDGVDFFSLLGEGSWGLARPQTRGNFLFRKKRNSRKKIARCGEDLNGLVGPSLRFAPLGSRHGDEHPCGKPTPEDRAAATPKASRLAGLGDALSAAATALKSTLNPAASQRTIRLSVVEFDARPRPTTAHDQALKNRPDVKLLANERPDPRASAFHMGTCRHDESRVERSVTMARPDRSGLPRIQGTFFREFLCASKESYRGSGARKPQLPSPNRETKTTQTPSTSNQLTYPTETKKCSKKSS